MIKSPKLQHMPDKEKDISGFAPVVLFVFKRVESAKRLVESLLENAEAGCTDLFIFSDGPRNESEASIVSKVRDYIHSIKGFKSVDITCAPVNKGLANSVINGVTRVLKSYDKVIVVEDDLLVSSNFLPFMNQALDYYKNNERILSIAGYTDPIKSRTGDDIYFTQRACSEGWATWSDKWLTIDWNVQDFESFKKSRIEQRRFNRMGSDMTGLLCKQMKGKVDSWAIRYCYHQFKNDLYTVYPTVSKVKIFGLDEFATHNGLKWNRFKTVLDESRNVQLNFKNNVQPDPFYTNQFVERFSIRKRAVYKVMDYIKSAGLL
jgi:hypothetical protein